MLVWSVAREQLRDVDVEIEQIPDRVAVMRLIESLEGLTPPWVRIRERGLVELSLDPRAETLVDRLLGSWPERRRHGARPHFSYDLLEHLRVFPHVGKLDGIELKVGHLQPPVVEGDTVPVEKRLAIGD